MAPPTMRRTALRLGCAVLTAGLAGCSALAEDEPVEYRLGELSVYNLNSRARTVHVFVFESGDPVYRSSMETEAFDAETSTAGGGAFEGYPTEPGAYEVYAWYDEQPSDEWDRFGPDDVNQSGDGTACAGLHVIVGDRKQAAEPNRKQAAEPRLIIFSSNDCSEGA